MKAVYTTRQFGDELQISASAVLAMIHRGELPEAFRVGPKLWRIDGSALQRLKPKRDTITSPWPSDPQTSASTNASPDSSASDGESTASNAKNAATPPMPKRTTARRKSGSDFARDFPEHANRSRSARSSNNGGTGTSPRVA